MCRKSSLEVSLTFKFIDYILGFFSRWYSLCFAIMAVVYIYTCRQIWTRTRIFIQSLSSRVRLLVKLIQIRIRLLKKTWIRNWPSRKTGLGSGSNPRKTTKNLSDPTNLVPKRCTFFFILKSVILIYWYFVVILSKISRKKFYFFTDFESRRTHS